MNPNVIFLHGWASQPGVFDGLRRELDLPHEALALLPEAETFAAWTDTLAADIAASHNAPVMLVGWSQGAQLAMDLAARHPQLVAGLVLIAATPRFVSTGDWPHGLDAGIVDGFRQGFLRDPQRTRQRFIALQTLGDADRHAVSTELDRHAADVISNQRTLAQGLKFLAATDLRTQLPSPALPAMLIHGEQDALMPPAATQWLAQRWHASQTLLLPGVGHAPHLSQANAVAHAVRTMHARLR